MTVRDLIKLIQDDGWVLVQQTGGHRQFTHPSKPGRVTVPGNLGKEIKPGTLASALRQAGLKGTR